MMVTHEDAVSVLGARRIKLFNSCIDDAWKLYDSTVRPVIPFCTLRGQANMLHELITQRVRDSFHGIRGVVIHDNTIGGRFFLEVDRRVAVQFKKLTHDFRTTNNATDTSDAWDRQELIEGFPSCPRLTVGYQLGQYGTAIAGRWLAFVIGKSCEWHHDLETGEHSQVFDFRRADSPSAAEQERAAKRALDRARRRKLKRAGDDNPPFNSEPPRG